MYFSVRWPYQSPPDLKNITFKNINFQNEYQVENAKIAFFPPSLPNVAIHARYSYNINNYKQRTDPAADDGCMAMTSLFSMELITVRG